MYESDISNFFVILVQNCMILQELSNAVSITFSSLQKYSSFKHKISMISSKLSELWTKRCFSKNWQYPLLKPWHRIRTWRVQHKKMSMIRVVINYVQGQRLIKVKDKSRLLKVSLSIFLVSTPQNLISKDEASLESLAQ